MFNNKLVKFYAAVLVFILIKLFVRGLFKRNESFLISFSYMFYFLIYNFILDKNVCSIALLRFRKKSNLKFRTKTF